jgi:hypothetical protein
MILDNGAGHAPASSFDPRNAGYAVEQPALTLPRFAQGHLAILEKGRPHILIGAIEFGCWLIEPVSLSAIVQQSFL